MGLAQAGADAALAVTNDNNSAEIETASALHNLGNPVDVEDVLGEFWLLVPAEFLPLRLALCHHNPP